MTARATATSCCWPPESWLGTQVALAYNAEPVERVAHGGGALGTFTLRGGERDIQVLVNRQVVESVW